MRLRFTASILATMVFTALIIQYSIPRFSSFMIPQETAQERRARFHWQRVQYDIDLMKDPATGKIPKGIFAAEMAQARTIPVRGGELARTTNLNTYVAAGPNNIGGRTRALAYDVRYNGTSNRVIIAGSVSGGIMRSADGGNNWTRVSPENDIHNITALAQDRRPGSQDTWYAGGGETFGNSANEDGAPYYGQYVWKSTDNGLTWTRLPLNTITDIPGNAPIGSNLEAFDHPFDFVHQIAVNPVNGDLYISGHRRVLKSVNGGNSFQTVFGSTVAATSSNGGSDVVVTNTGKVIIAMNGGNPDVSLRGVWTSSTGNLGSYTRIAGGTVLGVDSVANWRGNDPASDSRRIVLGLAPADNNIVYVLYENGLSSEPPSPKPEADLFRLNMTGGTNNWTNLSANMPDFAAGNLSGSDPFTVQGGYNMMVKVKPDNNNIVFIGGTNLYRSVDAFATAITANGTFDTWINGYQANLTYAQYANGHPDMHQLAFNPSNPNEAIVANDGGIQITSNIADNVVAWTMISNYQTLQYYSVGIDATAGEQNFIGGAQDNGTYFRSDDANINMANKQFRILGGDGATAAIGPVTATDFTLYASSQQGTLYRDITNNFVNITPSNLTANPDGGFGDFVTKFLLDQDNLQDLYYVNYNRLFRTTAASTVTSSTWTELTGVGSAISPTNGTSVAIHAMAISRGPYATSHVLYLGTNNGKIYRLNDPRNAAVTATPVDITPAGLAGNVQDIATNPNNDDEVMAVVSNYNTISVYWTNNAKSASPTWKTAEGNLTLPSYRSCMIVVKKDASNNPVTEYYVGTSVGLYSAVNLGATLLANGSPTWQREGNNTLNFAIVQSLAYRPVDNVLLVGTHGNGMYYSIIGSPNYTPNLNTGFNDPITNDKNFIRAVYPTITSNSIQYRIGNMYTIKKITVQLHNLSGQQMIKNEAGYLDGSIDISRFSRGVYILSINSEDGKYRHVQKIVKQ